MDKTEKTFGTSLTLIYQKQFAFYKSPTHYTHTLKTLTGLPRNIF